MTGPKLVVPLTDGTTVLVSDDMDDHTVWASATEHGCRGVVMLPDGSDWLVAHIDFEAIRELGGAAALVRPE